MRHLSKSDLTYVVRASWTFWRIGIPLIWRDLEELEGNAHICRLLQIADSDEDSSEDQVLDVPLG